MPNTIRRPRPVPCSASPCAKQSASLATLAGRRRVVRNRPARRQLVRQGMFALSAIPVVGSITPATDRPNGSRPCGSCRAAKPVSRPTKASRSRVGDGALSQQHRAVGGDQCGRHEGAADIGAQHRGVGGTGHAAVGVAGRAAGAAPRRAGRSPARPGRSQARERRRPEIGAEMVAAVAHHRASFG